jgi:hypothetical protein
METRLLVMKPGSPEERRTFELPERPTYNELRELLRILLGECDPEHVAVLADFAGGLNFKRADMFVDEMGHPKRLPRNEAATTLYRRATLLREEGDPELLDWIAGPAVLFERIVWT